MNDAILCALQGRQAAIDRKCLGYTEARKVALSEDRDMRLCTRDYLFDTAHTHHSHKKKRLI